uniref:Uncharacterized protein n=1 Tax=Hucho hucho TaxID=62062 RepID=A0A4W5K623_9TELE
MLIDETTTAESPVASNLVKLFQGQGLAKEFLDVLFKLELDKTNLGLQERMSLQCGSMEKEGFILLHRTKDQSMLMTSPFKKYFVTLSKDTLSNAKTQHSKVGALSS